MRRFTGLRGFVLTLTLIGMHLEAAVFSQDAAGLSRAMAQKVRGLEAEPNWNEITGPDWLLDGTSYRAGIYRGADEREIVLANGLLRRRFRLAPNGATVGLDNLITGESILRGVKPEALLEIDGVAYEVGGLKGQANYAFLRPEWIDGLKADPSAFQFVGCTLGEPQERLAWKRVRHHAPQVQWPPRGIYLRMDYAMPDLTAQVLASGAAQPSDLGRRLLLEDEFQGLDAAWTVHTSAAHARSSFVNEGKVGEIYTPANTCVFVERALSPEVGLVEATIDVGTDKAKSWGPGLALVWPQHTIKFNLRPAGLDDESSPVGLWDGRQENASIGEHLKLDLAGPVTLRLRLETDRLYCDARPERGPWKTCASVPLDAAWGKPNAVRIGKLDRSGGAQDFSTTGDLVRLRVLHFAAYSAVSEETLARLRKSLDAQRRIGVSVHYELYDGIPVYSKWITVHNDSDRTVRLNRFVSEILAAVEYGSAVETRKYGIASPNIHVETDYAFSSFNAQDANHRAVHWNPDPDYSSQVNYLRLTPCLLEVGPELGPHQAIAPGERFSSFRCFVLPFDSYDRERNGLAQRRLYRVLAPWCTENPLMMHARFADWERVKVAIDQCAEVGFEMVILTFGSGFNIENDSEAYLAKMRGYADYARSQGIEIGGYSLLASRRVGGGHDVVMPEGQRPTFGNSPCLHSEWGHTYFDKLYQFYEKTGFILLEHDGSYPGDVCISTEHPGHEGYEDSRWNQWKKISDFYKWCRGQGIYLNVPDYYYMSGSNKCGMGYREVNWSLPRAQQVIHTRQNIYDGAWQKTPSMGWMFVPLTQYHGGGAAATIEPLHEHLDHYERMIASNLGGGVQACYRGPRLYDTNETKQMVKQWVDWFKRHREVLEGDIIHLRRADSRALDYWLNVNPAGPERGLLMVFNPLEQDVTQTLRVPLYYTGLQERVQLSHEDGPATEYTLARDYSMQLDVTVKAKGVTWYVIR